LLEARAQVRAALELIEKMEKRAGAQGVKAAR
jgi:hypothetical protein